MHIYMYIYTYMHTTHTKGELVLELYGALVPRGPHHERAGAKDYLFGLNSCFQVTLTRTFSRDLSLLRALLPLLSLSGS